jgi:AraC family transcriptional regulator
LAEKANFSAFHFHRIFSAITGETLFNYIKRLRLEKAGRLLLHNPETPISNIAYECGFNNISVFCRNFKDRFQMNAQEFRDNWPVNFSKISQPESKINQLHSKESKSESLTASYVCRVETLKKGGLKMKADFAIKDMPAMDLVYCRHTGPFHLIGEAYAKLMKWAGPRGLIGGPDFKTVTVYHDDPAVTDIEKVRQSACITVEGPVKTEGEFGNLTVPAGKHVVGSFEISPLEFEQAWNSVCLWLSESGYQPADANPYELYHNDHEKHPEGKFIVDICIPVKPL